MDNQTVHDTFKDGQDKAFRGGITRKRKEFKINRTKEAEVNNQLK